MHLIIRWTSRSSVVINIVGNLNTIFAFVRGFRASEYDKVAVNSTLVPKHGIPTNDLTTVMTVLIYTQATSTYRSDMDQKYYATAFSTFVESTDKSVMWRIFILYWP